MYWRIFLIPAIVLATGFYLWWPPGTPPDRCSDLGTALMGGAIVAFSVFYLERQLSRAYEKRNLQLELGTGKDFQGIDLSGRDLSKCYLPGKDFSGANFHGANLSEANLSGANLTHASLNGADLRGAKLDETPLYPSETLYLSNNLHPGPIYRDANTQGADLSGAKYDSATRWPSHIDPEKVGAVRVDRSGWRRILG
jgi:uncharacterized protein YjbI with pentapeptide repeats